MIGDCRPVEALADLIDSTSAALRHTLQLYDGIADQADELARLEQQRRQVDEQLNDPPRRLDAQGEVLDEHATRLRIMARCQAKATLARAAATDNSSLGDAARSAWIERTATLDRVIAMAPTARHVETLACVHPPLPRPDSVAAEHSAAFFLRRLALDPLDEVSIRLQAMESVRRADLEWLVLVGETLAEQLTHLVLDRKLPERVLEPAVDRLLAMAIDAAEASSAAGDASDQAVRAVRQAGVGQATWLRDLAANGDREVRCTVRASYRLAFEIQVALWTNLRAARAVRVFPPIDQVPVVHVEGSEDPFRMRILAAQRLAQRLGRTLRSGADLLRETARFGELGADLAEISAWSAAVVADPGSSTNVRQFFERRNRCRR
ncbi:MAG: hypothetical protein AAGE94_13460 [Acidobacteriota bacterium]